MPAAPHIKAKLPVPLLIWRMLPFYHKRPCSSCCNSCVGKTTVLCQIKRHAPPVWLWIPSASTTHAHLRAFARSYQVNFTAQTTRQLLHFATRALTCVFLYRFHTQSYFDKLWHQLFNWVRKQLLKHTVMTYHYERKLQKWYGRDCWYHFYPY